MGQISYETHYKSDRPDGRHVMSLAGYMEKLRNLKPELALPESLTRESYDAWREAVKVRYRELLRMPPITRQPDPVRLSSAKRDGYTVEKWEFYPDEYLAVPFLALIPDGASKDAPVPGVLCIPGSTHSKELFAGEELLEPLSCRFVTYPERNRMGQYMVKNGWAAFVFDNIATAEVGVPVSADNADTVGYYSRTQMVSAYLHGGFCYPGMSTWQLESFMQYLPCFDYVDRDKLAVSGHSLGTEPAMALGVLRDDIRAVVFNDVLHSDLVRFVSATEGEGGGLGYELGNWHIIPGFMQSFDFPDLCAAIAPKYLAFNEGGADEFFRTVQRAYALLGAEDRLQITHYPKYQDPASRTLHGTVPRYGLSQQTHFDWLYCDAPDHSFRGEPSVRLLKKCFGE